MSTALSASRALLEKEPSLANAEAHLRCIDVERASIRTALSASDASELKVDWKGRSARNFKMPRVQSSTPGQAFNIEPRRSPLERSALYNKLAARDKEYRALNETNSQGLARNFASAFYIKLPLELRDMVYDRLWTGEMMAIVRNDSIVYSVDTHLPLSLARPHAKSILERLEMDRTPFALPCAGTTCHCFKWSVIPGWMRHQYVGVEVAKEVIAAYYRNAPPEQFGTQLDRLKDTLLIDHFHLGVTPADHIRQLSINLREDDISDKRFWDGKRTGTTGMQMLETNFKSLFSVRVKSAFKLTVRISCPVMIHFQNFPSLNMFRPLGIELRQAGAEVTLVPGTYEKLVIRLGDSGWYREWKDIVGTVLDPDSPSELWMDDSSIRELKETEDAKMSAFMAHRAIQDAELEKVERAAHHRYLNASQEKIAEFKSKARMPMGSEDLTPFVDPRQPTITSVFFPSGSSNDTRRADTQVGPQLYSFRDNRPLFTPRGYRRRDFDRT